jgi:tRNA/rRNA methyltransferase
MNKPEVPDFLKNIRVVLARPSHPGNVGSAARAMKTMGLTNLYLVEPKVFPHPEADTLASGAVDVLQRATVVSTLAEALAGVTIACALTSRRRELTTPLATPREAVPELLARAKGGEQVALVFGNETFGLSIDEVELCNRLVTIPGNPDYFSLNLSQAVQVLCYELFSQVEMPLPHLEQESLPATHDEVEGMLGHLESAMAKSGYFERRNSERLMRRMRRLFGRASVEREEIDILRGFWKQVERTADKAQDNNKD